MMVMPAAIIAANVVGRPDTPMQSQHDFSLF
jgi:hypothetical protein